jgi:hypothetical protein
MSILTKSSALVAVQRLKLNQSFAVTVAPRMKEISSFAVNAVLDLVLLTLKIH